MCWSLIAGVSPISAGVAYMTDDGSDSAPMGGHGGEVVSVSLG